MDFIYSQEQVEQVMSNIDKIEVKGLDNIRRILNIIQIINNPIETKNNENKNEKREK